MNPTPKQKEFYNYLVSYESEYGHSPTQKEIKEYFGFKSYGSVQGHLKGLEKLGLIKGSWNARRGWSPVKKDAHQQDSPNEETIPFYGPVAAGPLTETFAPNGEYVTVPPKFIKSNLKECFALKVQGESMIEEGIFEGDILILRKNSVPKEGQTIVALVEGEATLKKYYPHSDRIELRPANKSLDPLYLPLNSSFKVAGHLVALLRNYE